MTTDSTPDVEGLVKRLEEAKEGSRELDIRIHCALHGHNPDAQALEGTDHTILSWLLSYADSLVLPAYSASLDAAVLLFGGDVPPRIPSDPLLICRWWAKEELPLRARASL